MNIYWEDINHGDCHHLIHNHCVKRYFEIFDPTKERIQRIIICNEYLKLLMIEKSYNYEYGMEYYIHDSTFSVGLYKSVVADIIDIYSTYKTGYTFPFERRSKKETINPTIRYTICERPYIIGEIRLFDMVKLVTQTDYVESLASNNFKSLMVPYIKKVAQHLIQFKKYNYQKNVIERVLNKISSFRWIDNSNYSSQCIPIQDELRELFLIFFEIQINLKKQDYEAS